MTPGPARRFPIRYSIQRWKDGAWFYGSFLVILLVFIVVKLSQRQEILSLLPVLVLDAGILLVFWVMRLFSYVEMGESGLRIRYILRHLELPYQDLSRVRRQALEVAFQPAERRRFVNRFVRRLAKEPAAYIRLDRRQEGLLAQAQRQLGPRLVAGSDIVVPILDVDDFVAAMKGRLRGQGGG